MSNAQNTSNPEDPHGGRTQGTDGRGIVASFTAVFALTIIVLAGLFWHTLSTYRTSGSEQARHFRTVELVGTIRHFDEVLTMSARMAAATGDLQWERRYRIYEPELDAAIGEAMSLWPDVFISEAVSKTNLANLKLVDMENRAFDLVRSGDREAAAELLYSDEYERQKKVYSTGMQQVTGAMGQLIQAQRGQQKRTAVATLVLLAGILVFAFVLWLYALRVLRRRIASPEATT